MSHYLDLIVFAVIAVILLYRLRSVFGERQEGEPPPLNGQVIVVQAKSEEEARKMVEDAIIAQSPVNWAQNLPNYDIVATATAHHRLVPFASVDPQFRPDDFIEKAKKAFTLIVNAFASGDRKTLEFLIAPDLYAVFAAAIDRRGPNGDTYQAQLHGIKKAVIADAHLDGTQASVTVDFTAEQTILHKTADGTIVGDNDGSKQINHDRWTFSKDLKDPNPKWLLVRMDPAE